MGEKIEKKENCRVKKRQRKFLKSKKKKIFRGKNIFLIKRNLFYSLKKTAIFPHIFFLHPFFFLLLKIFHPMSPVGLRTVLWPWPPSLLFHESLLLVCESTWKVLPLMSDVVPVLAASVWSSCKGFSFFRLLNIWRHWSITKGEESDGGQVVFRGRSIKNQPFAPTSSKSSCLIWFDFILKILGVQLLFDACSLYTFIQFSLCACLTLLRMIWPVMRLMFLMSKATNKMKRLAA